MADLEERISVSKFKDMRIRDFRALDRVLLIEEYMDKPLAAVIPYTIYLQMQGIIIRAHEAIERYLEDNPNVADHGSR